MINARLLDTLTNKKAPLTGGAGEQGKLSLPYEGIINRRFSSQKS
jgi:hypothetical protein